MIICYKDINLKKTKSIILNSFIPIKKANEDFIILFQVGSFFETYFEDAKIFSNITGAQLTSRNFSGIGQVMMAGVPKESLENVLKKLLYENQKVCVYREYKDKDTEKVTRKLERKYTKGTISEVEFLDSFENNYIVALKKDEDNFYNLAYSDVSDGQFYKTKDNLKNIIHEVEKLSPSEIIISSNNLKYFEDILSKYNVTVLDEEYFDESCENIILKYCKKNQKDFLVELNNIQDYKINHFLFLDEATRRNLELTRVRISLKKRGSLFDFLNKTKTPMGTRLLKKIIQEPLCEIEEIQNRQNVIEKLIQNPNYLEKIQENLQMYCDISRICAKLSNTSIKPKELFELFQNTKNIEHLPILVKQINFAKLNFCESEINEILDFANKVTQIIDENSFSNQSKNGFIKEGYFVELDYLRSEFKNIEKQIEDFKKEQIQKLKIKELVLVYTKKNEWLIKIPKQDELKIPSSYFKTDEKFSSLYY
ncbi:hypothetical protein IJ670_03440, partial [bacterium]|nr:hypothetical protein [bacterium]